MSVRRADDVAYILALNVSATNSAVSVRGGEYMFMVEGTAGGATARLEVQTPLGNWAPVSIYTGSPVSSTTLPYCQTGIDLPACNVRLALIGGTPTGVFAYLIGMA